MDESQKRRRMAGNGTTEENTTEDVSWCFQPGSVMSDLVQAFDWGSTALGPIASWPTPWKTSLAIALSSHFPMVLWFGEDLHVLYNDAYVPQMGNKHPSALGRPGRLVWPEIWNVLGPMHHSVMSTAKPTWKQDQFLLMDRFGYPEETYWTYSYSPIRATNGKVIGVFTAVEETSNRYIAERRLETLRAVSAVAMRTATPEDVRMLMSPFRLHVVILSLLFLFSCVYI